MKFVNLVFVFVVITLVGLHGISADSLQDVVKELFTVENYDKNLRPIEKVDVKLGLSIVTILDMNVEARTISALMWLKMSYKDSRLAFDGTKHGIKSLRYPSSQVWLPDITMYNSAKQMTVEPTNVVIFPDGTVIYVPKVQLEATCKESAMKLFPLDTHKCGLKWGSWTYSADEVDLKLWNSKNDGGIGWTAYNEDTVENAEWEVEPLATEEDEKDYGDHGIYQYIIFNLELKRKPSAIQVILVFPAIMTSILTLAMFILPPECREKVTFGAILFLALIVLIAVLAIVIPAGGMVAIVGFYSVNLAFVTVGLLWHSFLVLMAYPSNSSVRPGRCLRRFASSFSAISCLGNEQLELDMSDEDDPDMPNAAKGARNIAEWRFLARMLDRLMLIIFALLLVFLGVLSIGF